MVLWRIDQVFFFPKNKGLDQLRYFRGLKKEKRPPNQWLEISFYLWIYTQYNTLIYTCIITWLYVEVDIWLSLAKLQCIKSHYSRVNMHFSTWACFFMPNDKWLPKDRWDSLEVINHDGSGVHLSMSLEVCHLDTPQ